MSIENIDYSDSFKAFLASLNDNGRVNIIETTLNDYAKGAVELDRRNCDHYENRDKAIICDANVVVYFDIKKDENLLVMIDGSEIEPRVA